MNLWVILIIVHHICRQSTLTEQVADIYQWILTVTQSTSKTGPANTLYVYVQARVCVVHLHGDVLSGC